MRSKAKILKGIQAQINNIRCMLVDDDLDPDFPKDVKKIMVIGHKKRIDELKEIKKRLENLLI